VIKSFLWDVDLPGGIPCEAVIGECSFEVTGRSEMVGQQRVILVGVECLKCPARGGVKLAAPRLQEAPVGHVMRQGVLEGIRKLGKEVRLVKEL
jgi:hypothetical protein